MRQEDIAAESILKRAELTRITRQLKSRLSKTNLKSKLNLKEASLSGVKNSKVTKPKHKDESSPIKLPPSSPLYEEISIPVIPKTPPQQKINLNVDVYNSNSTNKTQPTFSSPIRQTPKQQQTGHNNDEEGADLLMFLATSPSPIQYKNYPSTPQKSQTSSNLAPLSSTKQQQQGNQVHKFATPNTPKRNPLINSNNLFNLSKTPGFNMNDYVNLFSPSPRVTKTPGGFVLGQQDGEKDVNGKLIKF